MLRTLAWPPPARPSSPRVAVPVLRAAASFSPRVAPNRHSWTASSRRPRHSLGDMEEVVVDFADASTQVFHVGPGAIAVPALAGLEELHRRLGRIPWRSRRPCDRAGEGKCRGTTAGLPAHDPRRHPAARGGRPARVRQPGAARHGRPRADARADSRSRCRRGPGAPAGARRRSRRLRGRRAAAAPWSTRAGRCSSTAAALSRGGAVVAHALGAARRGADRRRARPRVAGRVRERSRERLAPPARRTSPSWTRTATRSRFPSTLGSGSASSAAARSSTCSASST